jgi:hypothetical protein
MSLITKETFLAGMEIMSRELVTNRPQVVVLHPRDVRRLRREFKALDREMTPIEHLAGLPYEITEDPELRRLELEILGVPAPPAPVEFDQSIIDSIQDWGRRELLRVLKTTPPDGVPCSHSGCLAHRTHPCDGCGKIGGRTIRHPEDHPKTEGRELSAGTDRKDCTEGIPTPKNSVESVI